MAALPTDANQVKSQLQEALDISYKGLAADNAGDIPTALQCYARVIETLTDILFYYNKQRTPDSQSKKMILESKRTKYIQRVNVLWELIPVEQKVYFGTKVPVPTGAKKALHSHAFTDFTTSYVNVISMDPLLDVFVPYSVDPMVATMERVQRIAQSIKYGAYYTPELYIPADLWSIAAHKIENVDTKSNAIQMLQKPLARLRSTQQADPSIANVMMLKQSLGEFDLEVAQVRTFIVLFPNPDKKAQTLGKRNIG
jgi:hypothetical protein